MIWESYPYKDELAKIADRMRERKNFTRWSDKSLFLFEKDFFTAFFLIRKLIEAKTKISLSLQKKEISLCKFYATGKNPSQLNWHKFQELYDLSYSEEIRKDLIFLCNQAIHSYVFCPFFSDKGKIEGVYVNSGHESKKALYAISLAQLIDIFNRVSSDYPTKVTYSFCGDKMDYIVQAENT